MSLPYMSYFAIYVLPQVSRLEKKVEDKDKELADLKEKATKEKQELEIKVARLEATQNMGAHIFNAFVGGLGRTGGNLVPPMATPRTSSSTSASANLPPGYSLSPPSGFHIEGTDL